MLPNIFTRPVVLVSTLREEGDTVIVPIDNCEGIVIYIFEFHKTQSALSNIVHMDLIFK
jgi:hypothetical protein